MTFEIPHAGRSRRLSRPLTPLLALALALALAACSQESATPESTTAESDAAAQPEREQAPAAATRTASMSEEDLREAARTAYRENRLYAPAEDNAVEYYLALRDKVPADAGVSSALTDLLPMTVIATEQSVQREDFDEAERLAELLQRVSPQHPALARLQANIESRRSEAAERAEDERVTAEEQAEREAELERERLAEQRQQQQQAARELASQEAAEEDAAEQAAEDRETERLAAEQEAAEQRAAEQRAAEQRTAAPTAADLRPVSTPSPSYPPAAYRARQSGVVQVEFTVGTDGSVTSARVVRADPARVFDREAVSAVRDWRFQPLEAPVTTRREIGFSLDP